MRKFICGLVGIAIGGTIAIVALKDELKKKHREIYDLKCAIKDQDLQLRFMRDVVKRNSATQEKKGR